MGCGLLLEYCSVPLKNYLLLHRQENQEERSNQYYHHSSELLNKNEDGKDTRYASIVPLYNDTTGLSFREALESVCKPVVPLTTPTTTTISMSVDEDSTTVPETISLSRNNDQQIQNAQLLSSVPSTERASVLTFMISVLLAHSCWALASKNGTFWDVRSEFEKILNHITHGTGKTLPSAPTKLRPNANTLNNVTGNNKLSTILPSPLTSSLTNEDMIQGKNSVWDLVFLAFRLAIQHAPEPAAAAEVTLALHDALAEYSSLHATCSLQEREELESKTKTAAVPSASPSSIQDTVLSDNSIQSTITNETNDLGNTDAETEIFTIEEDHGKDDPNMDNSTLFFPSHETATDISMIGHRNEPKSVKNECLINAFAPGLRVNITCPTDTHSSSSHTVGNVLNFTDNQSSSTPSSRSTSIPSWNILPQLSPGSAVSYPEISPQMSPCSTEHCNSSEITESNTHNRTYGRSVSVLSFNHSTSSANTNGDMTNTPTLPILCTSMQTYNTLTPSVQTVSTHSQSSDDSMHIEENIHELSSISHISNSSSDEFDVPNTDTTITTLPLYYSTPVSKYSSLPSDVSAIAASTVSQPCSLSSTHAHPSSTVAVSETNHLSSSTSKLVKLICYNADMLRSIAEPFCLKCLDNGLIVEEGIPYKPTENKLDALISPSTLEAYEFPSHSSQVMEGIQQLHINETVPSENTLMESLLGSRSNSSISSVNTSPSNGDHDRKRTRTSERGVYSPIQFSSSTSSTTVTSTKLLSTDPMINSLSSNDTLPFNASDASISRHSSTILHSINRPAPNIPHNLFSSSSSFSATPSKTASPLPPSAITTTNSLPMNESSSLTGSPGRPTAFKIRSPLGSPFRAGNLLSSSSITNHNNNLSQTSQTHFFTSPTGFSSSISTLPPESSGPVVVSLSSSGESHSSSMVITEEDTIPSSSVSVPFSSSIPTDCSNSTTDNDPLLADPPVLSHQPLKITLSPILTPPNPSRTLNKTGSIDNNPSNDPYNTTSSSCLRTLSSESTISYDESPSPSLLNTSGTGSVLPHRRSRGRVRWSAEVIEQQDTRRRLRLASLEENMLWDVSLANPLSTHAQSSSSSNTSPLLSTLSSSNTVSPLSSPCTSPRMSGSSHHYTAISHPLSPPPCPSPIPPAGPLLSTSISTVANDQYNVSSRLKGCWPIKIPSQRCWPTNPPHHSPLSPAFSHRLWYMYSHSNTTEKRMMMSVSSYYAHHHAFLDDDEYDRLVVALKRAISAAQSEVECYKEWEFISPSV